MHGSRGFSLVEAIVALAIVTTGVLSLAGLAHHVIDTVARSRRHLSAAVLADEYVSMRLGRPLAPTATDCLQRDVTGCYEALDVEGRPAGARPAFVRRWRIAAVPGAPSAVWALSVCVVPVDCRTAAGSAPGACISRVVAEVLP